MRFIETHSMGSDCTAPFNVEDYKAKTVEEFIHEMLKECPNSWGAIDVKTKNPSIIGSRVCEYNRGKTTPMKMDLLNLKIERVTGSGGWGCYDFDIWTKSDDIKIFERGNSYHLYVLDKDVWLNAEEMKRLYDVLGNALDFIK